MLFNFFGGKGEVTEYSCRQAGVVEAKEGGCGTDRCERMGGKLVELAYENGGEEIAGTGGRLA